MASLIRGARFVGPTLLREGDGVHAAESGETSSWCIARARAPWGWVWQLPDTLGRPNLAAHHRHEACPEAAAFSIATACRLLPVLCEVRLVRADCGVRERMGGAMRHDFLWRFGTFCHFRLGG